MASEAPDQAPNPNPETGEVNLFVPEAVACPHALYARLLEQCPVARSTLNGSPVISRYEDAVWALRHPEIFSSEMEMQMALGTERPMIPQQIDPPAQTRYRKILDPCFSRKRMLEIEPRVRANAIELIDSFIGEGKCEFDEAFAIPLPCTAFLGLMGLPQSELSVFLEMKDGIIRPHARRDPEEAERIRSDPEAAKQVRVETGQRIYAYFEDVIGQRRTNPGDDMVSYLVTAAEIDGAKLTKTEILDVCFLLLLAGLDTVTATLGCNIAYLANNPDQRRQLVENPALIPAAVEELMRWETPVTAVPRVVKQDVTIGGVDIKEGELATILLAASNLDKNEFGDSGVDFDRERNRHIAFGAGTHRCLGSHLARMELEVAMQEWHRRIPEYEIAPGETPRYSIGIREVQYLPLVWPAG